MTDPLKQTPSCELDRDNSLNKRSDEPKHTYPSRHMPGTHWATDVAWEILDALPVGMLPDDYRFLTAGRIAGALIKASDESRASALNHTRALERGR